MDEQPVGQPTGQSPGRSDLAAVTSTLSSQSGLKAFVTFRYMITPPLITVLWLLSVAGITIAALLLPNASVLEAIVFWIISMIWVRVVFEVMVVLFRINDGIQTMARRH